MALLCKSYQFCVCYLLRVLEICFIDMEMTVMRGEAFLNTHGSIGTGGMACHTTQEANWESRRASQEVEQAGGKHGQAPLLWFPWEEQTEQNKQV